MDGLLCTTGTSCKSCSTSCTQTGTRSGRGSSSYFIVPVLCSIRADSDDSGTESELPSPRAARPTTVASANVGRRTPSYVAGAAPARESGAGIDAYRHEAEQSLRRAATLSRSASRRSVSARPAPRSPRAVDSGANQRRILCGLCLRHTDPGDMPGPRDQLAAKITWAGNDLEGVEAHVEPESRDSTEYHTVVGYHFVCMGCAGQSRTWQRRLLCYRAWKNTRQRQGLWSSDARWSDFLHRKLDAHCRSTPRETPQAW